MSTLAPPRTSTEQLLLRAAERRSADAAEFARDGRLVDAHKARVEARALHAHAAAIPFEGLAGRRAPGNRDAVLRFARAVLAGGGER